MARLRRILITLLIAAGSSGVLRAQEPPAPKDDALDSLLEKLSAPSDRDGGASAKPSSGKDDRPAAKAAKPDGGAKKPRTPGGQAGTKAAKDDRPKARPKAEGDDALSGKDQEVDDLLKKLGETTDTPSPDERPRGGGGQQKPDPGPTSKKPGQPPDQPKLTGKDKETDEHLEELTGRKRRKKNDDGERTGAAGELIKEMREIEQKLEKPDTGDATREQQKKVVKRIEILIEEARRSGQSSMGRIVTRRVRRPGQQQPGGQQPGSTEGAMARGAPSQKPLKPTTKHANVGGKDTWGHLPDELRQEIENQSNELPLTTKRDLIDRYYLSVGKGKLVREESP